MYQSRNVASVNTFIANARAHHGEAFCTHACVRYSTCAHIWAQQQRRFHETTVYVAAAVAAAGGAVIHEFTSANCLRSGGPFCIFPRGHAIEALPPLYS